MTSYAKQLDDLEGQDRTLLLSKTGVGIRARGSSVHGFSAVLVAIVKVERNGGTGLELLPPDIVAENTSRSGTFVGNPTILQRERQKAIVGNEITR